MPSIDETARARTDALAARGLRRDLRPTRTGAGQKAARNGRELISFCSNDYLGLAHDPRVTAAAANAAQEFGAGAGASRLVTGNHPLLDALESRIAAWKETEAALVFGSGYLANVGAIPVLAEEGDLILIDELAHACQITGARLSKARTVVFRHNDMDHLAALLTGVRPQMRNCLIVTEGVFSMDGDLSPLPQIAALAKAHDAWTMVDDAHGLGVIGAGRGSARHWGVAPDVQMGTLSKAAGGYGGYIAASRAVIGLLISQAPSLIFATGLPPASAAAADMALQIMAAEPDRCATPLRLAQTFCERAGLPAPQSCIVPLILGAEDAALRASAALEEQGFLVTAIRPPTVPKGTARLRLTFAADHREEDVVGLAALIRELSIARRAAE